MAAEKTKIVVLTGAGVSAESGIQTFRDAGGLWEGHDVMAVATPEGWRKNRTLVLDFYNKRRRQLGAVKPNAAHMAMAELEKDFDVQVVTQNVDDLHERAGSKKVLHLHGELTWACSSLDRSLRYFIGDKDILEGEKCEKGSQLRPDIVWFGEDVPMYPLAAQMAMQADCLLVVGTSLQVSPASFLVSEVMPGAMVVVVDPNRPDAYLPPNVKFIEETATKGVPKAIQLIRNHFKAGQSS